MAKQEPDKYEWTFSHKGMGFLTTFQPNGNGDLNIYQISPWHIRGNKEKKDSKLTGINFEQHSERILLIAFLNYVKENNPDLDYLRRESGLLSRVKKLPDRGGNFAESLVGCSDLELKRGLENDLIWFNLEINGFLLDHGRIEVDKYKNLLLIPEYIGGEDSSPIILPSTQIAHAIYGIIFLASYGAVRTSKKELTDRLDYWRENILHLETSHIK